MISPPPPLPPGDYVNFEAGYSPDLVTSPGAVSRVLGPAGWNAAAWTNEDIENTDSPRKGISFRCPLTAGAKMIGFVSGSFSERSSYTALAYSIYCASSLPCCAYCVYCYWIALFRLYLRMPCGPLKLCAGTGTKVAVYEKGSHKGTFGSFGPENVLEIRLTSDGNVQFVDDGYVFYRSESPVSWPVHVGAVLHTVQNQGFEHIQYLGSS